MLQVLQHQSTGSITIEEVPAPQCAAGGVLVSVEHSLISAGTERTSVTKAQSSLLERALKQPQEVKKLVESVRKDGLAATFQKVQNTLDSYKPLGYSISGTVIESRTPVFQVGDRVACGGNAHAFHAEIVAVPQNLTVRLPNNVPFEDAAYTTLGAIAMQGVRQARLELGMSVAVIGLGLLGQITVQLCKAAGCRVVGLDVNTALFAAAQNFGAELTLTSDRASLAAIDAFTRGLGIDAVIITAATESNAPVELALEAVRKRGTVVVVGAVGMTIPRSPFYEKEVNFTISCSYGAGRYDPVYEEHGVDYPSAYVRWTENRNMQSFLDLVASGRVNVRAMTTHRFAIEQAAEAYTLITENREPYSGIMLNYSRSLAARQVEQRIIPAASQISKRNVVGGNSSIGIGFIGAGAFAQTNLLPHLKNSSNAVLQSVCNTSPVKTKSVAERFGFARYTTNPDDVFTDDNVRLIVCASRHDSHGDFALQALQNGKHIFVEKPLCISREELLAIDDVERESEGQVMVGFNRRFSAPFRVMKEFLRPPNTQQTYQPMSILYRVNAGSVPLESWIQDAAQGGRIIGEVCHFIDCMAFLTDALPVRVFAESISSSNAKTHRHDTVQISLKFSDGSIGTVQYFANGDAAVEKEYCEAFCNGKTAQMHNFTTLKCSANRKMKQMKFDGTKGHREEVTALLEALRFGKAFPIEYATLRAVTLATFAAEESLGTGLPVVID
jgi:predicted dehydrogenase